MEWSGEVRIFLKILFIFRERGKGGRERERNISVVVACAPPSGESGLQPRHVPYLRIEPVTLCFIGRSSIHRATPARAGGGGEILSRVVGEASRRR